MKTERDKWLKNLEVGDLVAINEGIYGTANWTIKVIDSVSSNGFFTIGSKLYSPKGECKISDWYIIAAVPVTDEIREKMRRKIIINRLKDIDWDLISTDKLQDIYEVVGEK